MTGKPTSDASRPGQGNKVDLGARPPSKIAPAGDAAKLSRTGEIPVPPLEVMSEFASALGLQYRRIKPEDIDKPVAQRLDASTARRFKAVIIGVNKDRGHETLIVAFTDPANIEVGDQLRLILNANIELVVATEDDVQAAIDYVYGTPDLEGAVGKMGPGADVSTGGSRHDIGPLADGQQVVTVVNTMLRLAIQQRATDIYVEPGSRSVVIRLRIDGRNSILHPPYETTWHRALISRIKVMANMDTTIQRQPSDGKIAVVLDGNEYDLRVSTVPTANGEAVAIRILDKRRTLLKLSDVGLSAHNLAAAERLITLPNGILLVTGPTGSGKTTTLYAALGQVNTPDIKIITLEDPVEYQIPGITQVGINPDADLTFANGLRAILRQSPDIILVGEIRDLETAVIAMQAAMTGHLVLSTLHTNDATSAPARLLNMGVAPYLISAALRGVVAQRLARVLCPDCKTPHALQLAELQSIGATDNEITRWQQGVLPPVYQHHGCERCHDIGFRGRTGIHEILEVDDAIAAMITNGATAMEIRQHALNNSMQPMRRDGWEKCLAGITTLAEIIRLCV